MIPVKDILKTLRTIINESATEEDSFTIETDEALKEFIRLALLALMNDEGVMAEASEMTDSSSISFEKRPDGLFFAYIKIPADYIRLVSVNLTGWRYPVTMLYPDNSPLYSAQYSSAPGVGNGPLNTGSIHHQRYHEVNHCPCSKRTGGIQSQVYSNSFNLRKRRNQPS